MADSILLFTYYWYNFMPLARGSAAVGYTTILSLFWAFGMPISVAIPKDYQTDWEAILTQARVLCAALCAVLIDLLALLLGSMPPS